VFGIGVGVACMAYSKRWVLNSGALGGVLEGLCRRRVRRYGMK
jgi:hypothetical protein